MRPRPTCYAIKADVRDPDADRFVFVAHKTMYGGKAVAAGDRIFVFASETSGGRGLIARGVVTASAPTPRTDAVRQTPRVSITVQRDGTAARPLGRAALRGFRDWQDGAPQTELNFKLYRQATDKIVGLTDDAAAFLNTLV